MSGSFASYVVSPGAGRSGIGNIVRACSRSGELVIGIPLFPPGRKPHGTTILADPVMRRHTAPSVALGPVAVDGPTGTTVKATRPAGG